MINRPVGIDLGTTNSTIALMDPAGDDLVLYRDRLRRTTFPSVVGWDPSEEDFLTGYPAWNRRVMQPYPVASIKRKMGSRQTVQIGPHELTPDEVSAKILGGLAADMRTYLAAEFDGRFGGDDLQVDRAVITVPAYFDAPQIEATRNAGRQAGLEVLGLLQEPTAAAMYYAWKHGIGDGTFLVYDLGGGTFDVSVIRSLMGEYQVLAIDGDNYLGGDDFDRRLAEKLRIHLVDQGYDLDLDVADDPDDERRFALLERLARQVKEALTTSEFQYVGRRDLFHDHSDQPITLDLEIGRDEFEELIDDLVDQTITACERALDQARQHADIDLDAIDYVLLVGGSTRIPLVQNKVADALCQDAKVDEPLLDEPDTCVGLGAAIHAANLAGVTWRDAPGAGGVELTIASSLSTRQNSTRLVGHLGGQPPADIHSAALVTQQTPAGRGGEVAAVTRVQHRPEQVGFEFDAIDLPDPGRYEFALDFCDDSGDALTSFDVFLKRLAADSPYRPTGSALSNPTVLAKDITLEVASGGQPERVELLARGTSLPAERSFQFHTADRSGAVVLRLFQNRFPIRTIHIPVPYDTDLGTPVELTMTVDQAMSMVAHGQVHGDAFSAQIEPPPVRRLRDWDAIESLLEQTDAIAEQLWGLEAKLFAKRVDSLVAGIRETARTDPDKLQVLVRRLEGALDEYRTRDTELTPSYSRMQTLLNATKRVVYRGGDDQPLGRTLQQWRTYLDELQADADTARDDADQQAWRRAFDQIQATWESLAQEEYRFNATNTAEYVQRLYLALSRRIAELKDNLDEFTLASNPDTEKLQRREIMHIQAELEDDVEQPLAELDPDDEPATLKPRLAQLAEVCGGLERRVDELPTLGLVRR